MSRVCAGSHTAPVLEPTGVGFENSELGDERLGKQVCASPNGCDECKSWHPGRTESLGRWCEIVYRPRVHLMYCVEINK